MAITNGYATLEEFKAWMSDQVPVGLEILAERAVESASRWIDNYCATQFYLINEARTFELGGDIWTLPLGNWNPLSPVDNTGATATPTIQVDTDRNGTWETTINSSAVQLWPPTTIGAPEPTPFTEIRFLSAQLPPALRVPWSPQDLVKVTGWWGWPEVPYNVRQACLIQASRTFHRRNSPGGVAGFDGFGVVRVSSIVDPDVASLLAPYRVAGGMGFA